MLKSLKYYLENNLLKRESKDPQEAQSLLKKAIRRLDFIRPLDITQDNASFIFEDAYEVMRESTQSLMALKGFKPYSHEATIAFVKEFYPKEFSEAEINKFNRFRIMRNDSVYKGKPVNVEETKEIMLFAKSYLKKIKAIYKKEIY